MKNQDPLKSSDTDTADFINKNYNGGYLCGACKPGFQPIYHQFQDEEKNSNIEKIIYFPKRIIKECRKIDFCGSSKYANQCQECAKNYHKLSTGLCEVHSVTQTDPFCEVYVENLCETCKDKYVKIETESGTVCYSY